MSSELQTEAVATPLTLSLQPIGASASLRDQAYAMLRQAIADADIYQSREEIRLDERVLSESLGVSRTPVREAMTLLEQEGFLRMVPRRGIYIVRKSKREIVEMIQMWAALESMAARLATLHATDEEIARLRHMFDQFRDSTHDDLAERPRVALDRRSSAHHRGTGKARHRTRRASRARSLAWTGCFRRSELRFSRLSVAARWIERPAELTVRWPFSHHDCMALSIVSPSAAGDC